MKLDTANRSFAGLAGASLLVGMFVFCGAVACVLVALLVSRATDEGLGAVTGGGRWLAFVFIVVIGAGAVRGGASVVRQVRASRGLARRLRALELALPADLGAAERASGLEGRVTLVESDERFSFAYGALTPRVVVSRGLIDAASERELAAVLHHERYHVRNLDPLKVMLARAAPATFFYLPILRGLHVRYMAGRELAADRRAVTSIGRAPLAGALLKVVRGPQWPELHAAAAIGGSELLDVRLGQLETGTEPPITGLTAGAVVWSLVAATALTALFVASVAAFGGPSAVARTTGTGLTPLDVAGGLMCAAPWAFAGWAAYRWLVRRTRQPLDTTRP